MRQYLLGVVGWLVVNPILDMMGVKRVIKGGRQGFAESQFSCFAHLQMSMQQVPEEQ